MARFEISCAEVRRELSNYIDEEVPENLPALIERHVLRCDGCRALIDGTRNLLELVSTGEVFAVPSGFSSRLFARLNRGRLQ